MATRKKGDTSPAVQAIQDKIDFLRRRIEADTARIEGLEAEKARAEHIDELKPGAHVIYTPARGGNPTPARIIAVTEEGKGAWYTVRINEDTPDETTRKARLAEISLP